MDLTEAAALGLLQGITEFLPVSSSGHLILAEHFMGLSKTPLAFDVMLHMGTLVAVLLYFRREWWGMATGLLPGGDRRERRLLGLLVLGTIPGGLAGVALEDLVSSTLRSPWVVVAMLAGVGLLLAVAERFSTQERNIRGVGLADALVVGAAQALALIPGTSRSGITMAAGLFRRLSREDAARFSFLLSAPIIAGAGGVEGLKLLEGGVKGVSGPPALVGFLVSFISGYLVIALFLSFLRRHTLYPFVVYRLALAGAVAALLLAG